MTLKKGSIGLEVMKLESQLNMLGYSVGIVNDIFDADTEWGVKKFQREHGLEVDGEVGKITQAALTALQIQKNPSAPARPGQTQAKGNMVDWYPKAAISATKMKTQGTYDKGFPVGAVVHYTAGAGTPASVISQGIQNGYAYVCIGRDGKMVQAHPITKWGWHAGESKWTSWVKKLIGQVSDDLIGIEIISYGKLDEQKDGSLKAWTGKVIPKSEARYTEGRANQAKGWYEKFTPQQEEALMDFLMFLKGQAPAIFDFDLVLGHDEVSGPRGIGFYRKVDPGASLSMTMDDFRQALKKRWENRAIVQG